MKNSEKFKEVFGFVPSGSEQKEVCSRDFDCEVVPSCRECPFNEDWWNREYKACFKLKEG